MKSVLSLFCALFVAIAAAQEESHYDAHFAMARGWELPSESQFKLHVAAFGRAITKHEIDFSVLRDKGYQMQFVYGQSGEVVKLKGFFYILPAGQHGLKRFYYQAYSSTAAKADDVRIGPTSLFLGKPGKERLDTSWFRQDLTAEQQKDVELGNFDVSMFGNYRSGVTVTFKPWVSKPREAVPYIVKLIWPDGKWLENGTAITGERSANFTITVAVR